MAVKLIVSNIVAFDVRFTLNDNGAEREFGFRVEAQRAAPAQAGETIGAYLAEKAAARMVKWLQDAEGNEAVPLVDDDGTPVAAGPTALGALYDLVENMPGLVYAGYLEAKSAKAKLGN